MFTHRTHPQLFESFFSVISHPISSPNTLWSTSYQLTFFSCGSLGLFARENCVFGSASRTITPSPSHSWDILVASFVSNAAKSLFIFMLRFHFVCLALILLECTNFCTVYGAVGARGVFWKNTKYIRDAEFEGDTSSRCHEPRLNCRSPLTPSASSYSFASHNDDKWHLSTYESNVYEIMMLSYYVHNSDSPLSRLNNGS